VGGPVGRMPAPAPLAAGLPILLDTTASAPNYYDASRLCALRHPNYYVAPRNFFCVSLPPTPLHVGMSPGPEVGEGRPPERLVTPGVFRGLGRPPEDLRRNGPFATAKRRRGAQSGPTSAPAGLWPMFTTWGPHPQFIHELVTGRLDLLDPATRGPDGQSLELWDRDNGWPVLQCTRCLRSLPTADGGAGGESHLCTCRFWQTTEELRRTLAALGPDALPPMPPRPTNPDIISASGGRRPETGPQRPAGPLGGPAVGGPDDGVNGDTGMVGGRPAGHPRLHGGGQPAVVSPTKAGRRGGIPRNLLPSYLR